MESSDGGRSWSLLSNHWAPNAALPGAAGTDQIVTLGYRQTVDTLTNLSCSSTGQVVEIGNSSVGGSAVHVIRSFTTSFRVNRSVPGFENHTWPPVIVHSGPIVPASPAPTSADGGGSSWLTTMYGHGDGPYRHWSRRPTVYLVKSTDGGENWQLRSKIDWQPAFGNSSDGPGEPSMARLPSGRLLLVFRSDATAYFWKAFSDDEGEHWSPPAVMDKQGGQWSVRPQLRVLSNGLLVLSGGRPGIKLWVCADGAGESWQEIDIAREHNARTPVHREGDERDVAVRRPRPPAGDVVVHVHIRGFRAAAAAAAAAAAHGPMGGPRHQHWHSWHWHCWRHEHHRRVV
jgi:hypothetical protein